MFKQLKAIATLGAMTVVLIAAAPASAENFPERVWTAPTTTAMDKNKDGVAAQQGSLDHVGAQLDVTGTKKAGQFNKSEFVDKNMVVKTYDIMG
jgi:hypothetical protein